MKGASSYVLLVVVVGSLLITSSYSFYGSVNSRFAVVADDTFEVYQNNNELKPTSMNNWSQDQVNLSWYHSKYCGYSNDFIPVSRCNWENQGDSYNLTVQNGDVISLKYYNFVRTTSDLQQSTLVNFFIVCSESSYNVAGFMAELTTNDTTVVSISINWLCTPGNPTPANTTSIDLFSDEDKIFNASSSLYNWTSPSLAAKNQQHAWRNDTRANPGPGVWCADSAGNSIYYAKKNHTVTTFTTDASWLYNVFPTTTYAYCRGIVSIVFSSSIISPNTSFSFNGSQLTLQPDAPLLNSTSIVLQGNQNLNFTKLCVTLAGNLTIYINSSAGLNGITPVSYECRANGSQFGNVQIIDNGENNGCEVSHEENYDSKGLNVLFTTRCSKGGDDDDNTRKVVVGVVVGVLGFVCLALVITAVVVAVIVHLRRGKSLLAE